MKFPVRALAALLMTATLAPVAVAAAQDTAAPAARATALATERDKVSYMIGMDVAASLRGAGPQLDVDAFERSFRNALAGGEPLVDEATAEATMRALGAHLQARNGGLPPGTALPEVDWTNAALVAGVSVGMGLRPVAGEFELPLVLQAIRTVLAGEAPLLSEPEYTRVHEAFSARMQAAAEAEFAALATRNLAEGQAFLAANKAKKGVFITGSGLQYMVLRPGAGARPKATDTVRVQYAGTLLDGTEFDSSYARGEPAEFRLDQVIPGWTEGVALMPVGAKYRFWVPAELAYGAEGTPGGPIGPNATLAFDVELLAIP